MSVEDRPVWRLEGWNPQPDSTNNGVQEPVMSRKENSLAWLPTGWIVEIKTRKSGAQAGGKYKCYLDPVTGSRFYSKGEVLRYLSANFPTSAERSIHVNSNTNIWTSSNQKSTDQNFTAYLCTSSNQKGIFGVNSVIDVCASSPQKWSTVMNSASNVCMSSSQKGSVDVNSYQKRRIDVNSSNNVRIQIEYSPKGLPQGWIKEIRFRKTSPKGHPARKDPYYIEPATGYMFRSLKDVSRYIEKGEVNKRVYRPKERRISDMCCLEMNSPPQIAAREPKTQGTTVRRCLFSEQIPITDAKTEIDVDISPGKLELVPLCHSLVQSLEGAGLTCFNPTNADCLEEKSVKETQADNKLYPACCGEGKQGHESESRKETVDPVSEKLPEPLNEKTQNNPLNEKTQSNQPLQPEDMLLEPGTEKLPLSEVNKQNAMDVQKQVTQVRRRGRPRKQRRGSQLASRKPIAVKERKRKSVKPITMPLRASKRLAGLKAEPIAITEISDPSSRAKAKWSDQLKVNRTKDSKRVFERSDKLNDIPIIDLESDEPEINEPLEEQVAVGKLRKEPSGIPLQLPFGEWHDPCIEFAFKTLTGDIPPLEGCSAIMDYFRQKLISIQSPSQNGSSTLTLASPESSPKPSLHSEGRAP